MLEPMAAKSVVEAEAARDGRFARALGKTWIDLAT